VSLISFLLSCRSLHQTQPFIAPETKYEVYPAGPSFIGHARRQIQKLSFEEDDKIQAELHHELLKAKAIEQGEELYPGLGEEQEDRATLAYDPKEWKVSFVPQLYLRGQY
jgi:DnaJ family protein C protein 2